MNDSKLGWTKIMGAKEENGLLIQVYRRPIAPNSDIMMSRADLTLRNAPLRAINYIFGHYEEMIENNTEMKDKILKFDCLERSGNSSTFHMIIKLGLLASNRESIVSLSKKKINDNKYLWITQS